MSTRATYLFEAGQIAPAVCFYIHHDGYLEGAAAYFKAAVLFENARGGLPAQFLRANDNAEFTESHQIHGDTEFRYTVKPDSHELLVEKYRHDTESWHRVYQGSLVFFIQQYEGTQLVRYRGTYLSHELAIAKQLELLTQLKHLLEGRHTGNASSVANDVWALDQLLIQTWGADDFTRLTAQTIARADRYFVRAYGWATQMGIDDEEAYSRWVARFRTPPEQEPQA